MITPYNTDPENQILSFWVIQEVLLIILKLFWVSKLIATLH
ncbi:hypothetical protein RINTHH_4530 [Richelia intracellularis HH01]|uniref:Uncharacterized protein n=1 Tax=Richelia intracellularis HH01 TaxID=1165094 RepID=M1WZ93_9NOST|nr:hypothetical protein RINTHH_4530 [Richelia intracellularis HH01]